MIFFGPEVVRLAHSHIERRIMRTRAGVLTNDRLFYISILFIYLNEGKVGLYSGKLTSPVSGFIYVIPKVFKRIPKIAQTPIIMVMPTIPQIMWLLPVVFFSSLV